MRVVSRSPGPAVSASARVIEPVRRSVRTSATEAAYGRWLVSATSASWSAGATDAGLAPSALQSAAARPPGDPASSGRPISTGAPRKRSARAASIPDDSDPASGCAGT